MMAAAETAARVVHPGLAMRIPRRSILTLITVLTLAFGAARPSLADEPKRKPPSHAEKVARDRHRFGMVLGAIVFGVGGAVAGAKELAHAERDHGRVRQVGAAVLGAVLGGGVGTVFGALFGRLASDM